MSKPFNQKTGQEVIDDFMRTGELPPVIAKGEGILPDVVTLNPSLTEDIYDITDTGLFVISSAKELSTSDMYWFRKDIYCTKEQGAKFIQKHRMLAQLLLWVSTKDAFTTYAHLPKAF